jgi:hypothetical protein
MMELDHVIIVAEDLVEAASRLLADHGLASIAGGRHAGHGTGNRIVPLGTTYLEIMAVVDPTEAATSPMGRWAASQATASLCPSAVCLRTDNIDLVAAELGEVPLAMDREKPDGSRLSWHLAGLDGMLGSDNLPFFIQWHCDPHQHPGAGLAPHRVVPRDLAEVTVGVPDPLWDIIGSVPGLRRVNGAGTQSATISTDGIPIILD